MQVKTTLASLLIGPSGNAHFQTEYGALNSGILESRALSAYSFLQGNVQQNETVTQQSVS